MLAVRVVEFTNAVEFTVTPPGLLVPLMNHCALAPAWKPLPPTVTLRLTVPWVAEFGVALVTDICADIGWASMASVKTRNIGITAGRTVARRTFIFLTPFANPAGPFAPSYTDTINGFPPTQSESAAGCFLRPRRRTNSMGAGDPYLHAASTFVRWPATVPRAGQTPGDKGSP